MLEDLSVMQKRRWLLQDEGRRWIVHVSGPCIDDEVERAHNRTRVSSWLPRHRPRSNAIVIAIALYMYVSSGINFVAGHLQNGAAHFPRCVGVEDTSARHAGRRRASREWPR